MFAAFESRNRRIVAVKFPFHFLIVCISFAERNQVFTAIILKVFFLLIFMFSRSAPKRQWDWKKIIPLVAILV